MSKPNVSNQQKKISNGEGNGLIACLVVICKDSRAHRLCKTPSKILRVTFCTLACQMLVAC